MSFLSRYAGNDLSSSHTSNLSFNRVNIFKTMDKYFIVTFLILCSSLFRTSYASEILRPRGVSISKSSLYVPERDFTCFDGSATIPFMYVNDDYCDCKDGSDEPGTPACPNGTFHCTNAGHRPLNIPSSRVNDGICDCCDTSDEYATQASCVNNCNELGRAARAEAVKLAELMKQGSELRVHLSKKGKLIRQEKQERLHQLEKDHAEAEKLKKEKEILKVAAEDLESSALERYRQEEEENRKQDHEEQKKVVEEEAFEYFRKIDSNQDGKLQIIEIRTQQTFDHNRDGSVSDEEVKYVMDQLEEMDWEDFLTIGWPRMKPLFMMNKGMFLPPEKSANVEEKVADDATDRNSEIDPSGEGEEHQESAEEEDDLEEEEELHPEEREGYEEEEAEDGALKDDHEETEEAKPTYDEETQKLIDEANGARAEYDEADRNVRDILREIQQIKDSLQKDYGPEEEFAPLDGECFEFTDTEYIYKLCPFDQATQRSKSGGADTRLGSWSGWVGPEGNKYQSMLFDGGQSCWNGPQRSTHVKLSCGTENALTSVSEPNRCEYVFEFVTPSVCQMFNISDHQQHDEL